MAADAPLLAAVDGGGSASRAVLAVGETVVARVEAGPLQLTTMDPRAVHDVLDVLLDRLTRGADPRLVTGICLGIAGAGDPEQRSVVERWAQARLPAARTRVCRDVDLVLAAGSADGAGIAAIAGTGAIVFARDADGVERSADGRGPLVGDRGGGFQLGLDAIRLVIRLLDATRLPPEPLATVVCETLGIAAPELAGGAVVGSDRVPFAQIASVGGRVCALAANGDGHAQSLVTGAARELAASYRMVCRRMQGADQLRHLLAGGLATTPAYRTAFLAAAAGADWQVIAEPLLGGLVIAADRGGE